MDGKDLELIELNATERGPSGNVLAGEGAMGGNAGQHALAGFANKGDAAVQAQDVDPAPKRRAEIVPR